MNEEEFRKIAKEYAEMYFTKGIDSTKIFKYVDELEKKIAKELSEKPTTELALQFMELTADNIAKDKEIDRLNNIISQIETLVINHNCDTGDIYYKYNGKYLKSELKERIIELVELKENK